MTPIPLAALARGIACLLPVGASATLGGGGVDVRAKLMRGVAAAGLPVGPVGAADLDVPPGG